MKMTKENITQEFIFKNIEEKKIILLKKKDLNKLISKKHKKGCTVFNYIEQLLILTFRLLDLFQFLLLLLHLVFLQELQALQ